MLLKSWISSTLTEERMHLLVGCLTDKEMWEYLEKSYIQAPKIINCNDLRAHPSRCWRIRSLEGHIKVLSIHSSHCHRNSAKLEPFKTKS